MQALRCHFRADDPAKRAVAGWFAPALAERPRPTAAALKAITGRYEGRRVDLVGGKLRYTWRDRFHLTLEPLAGDLLAIEGVRDFRFRILRKGGKVTALERIDRDGTTQTYARLD